MNKNVNVAILDSGCRFETYEKVAVKIDENLKCEFSDNLDVCFEHGDVIGNIIKSENTNIYDIQIFQDNLTTTPLQIFYALSYLENKNIDVINMSLGFSKNYIEIEDICKKLIKKGVTIVCSYPRKSDFPTYPASYENIIKVTSEGLCSDDNVVSLDSKKLFFGANPFSNSKQVVGSSVATAKFTSEFCKYLKEGFSKDEILEEFSKRRVYEPK